MSGWNDADLRKRMDGAIEVLRREFAGLRTGRASASLLEPLTVPLPLIRSPFQTASARF